MLRSLVAILTVVCCGCAARYQAPSQGEPVARLIVVGADVPVAGSLNLTSTVLLDRNTCEQRAFFEPTKAKQTSELAFAASKPIVLAVGFGGLRRATPPGASPIFACNDGLHFTPVTGKLYRVALDAQLLQRGVCRATLQEADEETQVFRLVEVEHVCQRQ